MAERINNRYIPKIYLEEIRFAEASLADDLKSTSGELVQLFILRTAKPSELVRNIVQRRAYELMNFHHPSYLNLFDFGYDNHYGCYYFVYPYATGSDASSLRTLDKYIPYIKPSLEWSIEILIVLSRFINDLHARDIAHGGINSSCIMLCDSSQPQLQVTQTGLVNLIDLLKERTGSADQTTFDTAAENDVLGFGQVVAELLCHKITPSLSEIQTAIQDLPVSMQQDFRQMIGHDPNNRFVIFSDIRRTLDCIFREIKAQEAYHLNLIPTTVEKLFEYGFINQPIEYVALAFMNREVKRGVYAWAGKSADGEGRAFKFTTSQMRLICIPDKYESPPGYFVVLDVHIHNPADLAFYKEKSLKIQAGLRFVNHKNIPSGADVTPLMESIEIHVKMWEQMRESELEDKRRLKEWEVALSLQRRRLREFQLRFYEWKEVDRGAAVEISLTEEPGEDTFDLSDDDLLCMTFKDGFQKPVGYFEDLTGKVLKLGLARNIILEDFDEDGVITIDNHQAEAVLSRQVRAMKRVRFRETVNPNLPDIISDPKVLTIDNPSVVDLWFQDELLDASQRNAVQKALATCDMFLIQGRPGTGKTTVIAELVLQIIIADEQTHKQTRILVTSQSNVAVNNALDKIVDLRKDLRDSVVRVGREEKAGSTEGLLIDRQLQSWQESVLKRSNKYFSNMETQVKGGENLTNALGRLEECQELEEARNRRQDELQGAACKLAELESEYARLENALNRVADLRQQAESILGGASAQDERLKNVILNFENEYLDWATAFLDQANKVAGISFQRSEITKFIASLNNEIERIQNEIKTSIEQVNQFLEIKFNVTHNTVKEQRAFFDQHFAHRREEMARLGRIRRLLEEWQTQVEKNYGEFASAYLRRCKVVGATCIGVAAKGDVSEMEFDWVIVDEAGKATPPELLVPLVRGRKIVLVGDHRQLPPTIDRELDEVIKEDPNLSRERLEVSLFQDLIEGVEDNVQLPLTVQYRMHPAIGTLVGECFYQEVGLENGVSPSDRQHGLSWCTRPVVWYSTKARPNHHEVKLGYSRLNQIEVDEVISLLERLETSYAELGIRGKTVGVITGYLAQKAALRQKISVKSHLWTFINDVEVNTVDAYQGRERDIIIYSVVRSNPKGKIGFLRDDRRLNVALSRARELLIIVGDEDIEFADVRGDNPFYTVIQHIRSHPNECVLEVL